MSQTKRLKNFSPARRPQPPRAWWLLACMVPYLFFALFGEGLHTNHLPDSFKGATTSNAAHLTSNHSPCAIAEHHSDRDADCPACQWAANSTAFLALVQPLPTPAVEIAHPPEAVAATWTSSSTASPLGRGPPAV